MPHDSDTFAFAYENLVIHIALVYFALDFKG